MQYKVKKMHLSFEYLSLRRNFDFVVDPSICQSVEDQKLANPNNELFNESWQTNELLKKENLRSRAYRYGRICDLEAFGSKGCRELDRSIQYAFGSSESGRGVQLF